MSAAVLQRSRRATAGKRIASLIGQAAEDDDAFWSHKIWSEGGGGFSRGNEDDGSSDASGSDESDGERSYHASDEDSEVAVDTFDSDFDESESESESEDAEAELLAEERAEKRAAKAGVGLMKRGRGAIKQKRVLGEGWNAGLALNWFPAGDGTLSSTFTGDASAVSTSAAPLMATSLPATVAPSTIPTAQFPALNTQCVAPTGKSASTPLSATSAAPPTQLELKFPTQQTTTQHSIQTSAQTIVSIPTVRPPSPSRKRNLRAGTLTKTITTVQQSEVAQKVTKQRSEAVKANQKQHKGKRHFTQEEMILEALKETEVENNKWLLGRKRKKEAVQEEVKQNAIGASGNIVERSYSRRGGCNVISFMDMERLPHIFTQQAQLPTTHRGSSKRKRSNSESSRNSDTKKQSIEKCVITGKEARYRDPKTMMGYYDLEAFKELRRRADAGLLKSKHNSGTKNSFRGKSFRRDRTIMASTSTTSAIKVMVTQNGTPVSPPETDPNSNSNNVDIASNKFPTKRGPPLLPEAALSRSAGQSRFKNGSILHSGESIAVTTQTVTKNGETTGTNFESTHVNGQTMPNATIQTSVPLASNNGSNHSSTVFPSRKSPRTPKPSAKVLDKKSSNQSQQAHRAVEKKSTKVDGEVSQSSSNNLDKVGNAKTLQLSEDSLRADSSPTNIPKQTANPSRSKVNLAPDTTNSIGLSRTIENANEPGSRRGSCGDTNISSSKEIAA